MKKIYCVVFKNLMNKSKGHCQKEMEPFENKNYEG